jgi:hypothetical protein
MGNVCSDRVIWVDINVVSFEICAFYLDIYTSEHYGMCEGFCSVLYVIKFLVIHKEAKKKKISHRYMWLKRCDKNDVIKMFHIETATEYLFFLWILYEALNYLHIDFSFLSDTHDDSICTSSYRFYSSIKPVRKKQIKSFEHTEKVKLKCHALRHL